MKERPIIFSGEMVRAIRAGVKKQTRRVVKPQPNESWARPPVWVDSQGHWCSGEAHSDLRCPYGCVGDRLWVRETFMLGKRYDTGGGWPFEDDLYLGPIPKERPSMVKDGGFAGTGMWVGYRADNNDNDGDEKWRPSIHMPRWASRITLEVTDVRVQRVQDTSDEDAQAEGVKPFCPIYGDNGGYVLELHKDAFAKLWDSINAKRGYGWDVNPYVWAITFKGMDCWII